MSDLNMQIVREFFELHLFRVLTHWQHEALFAGQADPSVLLFVDRNPAEEPPRMTPVAPGILLHPENVGTLQRAVVEVRAWHADRVYPSVVEGNAILGHVATPEVRQLGASLFGTEDFATVLVISELPNSPKPRDRSLQLLQGLGIDHVLEFAGVLQDLVQRINAHGNYAPSQTLQTLRLLKRYNLVRNQQLEFAFSPEP
jgi:hypothetical protein